MDEEKYRFLDNDVFYRYMSVDEYQKWIEGHREHEEVFIQNIKKESDFYCTQSCYYSTYAAKAKLALPVKPDVRVQFKIRKISKDSKEQDYLYKRPVKKQIIDNNGKFIDKIVDTEAYCAGTKCEPGGGMEYYIPIGLASKSEVLVELYDVERVYLMNLEVDCNEDHFWKNQNGKTVKNVFEARETFAELSEEKAREWVRTLLETYEG